ncbi:MAG: glutamate--cysteine ligase, partial [Luminiphilus sp.]
SLGVCYNNLDNYLATLTEAIMTPHPEYRDYKLTDDGEQAQLNEALLQIENEFYSPIRPKRVAQSGEAPVVALRRGGIEYIEVRCIDINPFLPLGIDGDTMRLIDVFLVDAILSESPLCDEQGQRRNKENLRRVVNEGRSPDLRLLTAEGEQPFTDRAMMLLDSMNRTAQWLDEAAGTEEHEQAMAIAYQRVANPETTPSARVLAEMGNQGIPFWQLALNYSRRWHNEFLAEPLQASEFAEFQTASAASLRQQELLEDDTSESFAEYLQRFYSQYR